MQNKKIILTGGGTAGHVIPNLALIPALKAAGFEIFYIGSHEGIERELIESAGIPYFGISSGKLRRYINLRNITDVFRVVKGVGDALRIIRRVRPDIIFSKGGFVVVPVIAASRILRVKSVIHESDITPGLANKLAIPITTKVCVSFPETLKHVPKDKSILTGTPIRPELLKGNKHSGFKYTKLIDNGKPVLLVTGGSQGATAINNCIRALLPEILNNFQVVHLCGKGNLSGKIHSGYVEFEYVNEAMPDILAMADIVISRAGANTIFELLALQKPNILIPLPLEVSRGDQILNAESFKKQGFSMVLEEKHMTPERLKQEIKLLYTHRVEFQKQMSKFKGIDGISKIMDVLLEKV